MMKLNLSKYYNNTDSAKIREDEAELLIHLEKFLSETNYDGHNRDANEKIFREYLDSKGLINLGRTDLEVKIKNIKDTIDLEKYLDVQKELNDLLDPIEKELTKIYGTLNFGSDSLYEANRAQQILCGFENAIESLEWNYEIPDFLLLLYVADEIKLEKDNLIYDLTQKSMNFRRSSEYNLNDQDSLDEVLDIVYRMLVKY